MPPTIPQVKIDDAKASKDARFRAKRRQTRGDMSRKEFEQLYEKAERLAESEDCGETRREGLLELFARIKAAVESQAISAEEGSDLIKQLVASIVLDEAHTRATG